MFSNKLFGIYVVVPADRLIWDESSLLTNGHRTSVSAVDEDGLKARQIYPPAGLVF